MKTTIVRLVETRVEIELPTVCPECKADFTQVNGSLIEDGFTPFEWRSFIDRERVWSDGFSRDLLGEKKRDSTGELNAIITGYRCRCGHALTPTGTHEYVDQS